MPEPLDERYRLGKGEPPPPPCYWCGEPATTNAEVEKPRRGKNFRASRQSPVCGKHFDMILRNRAEAEAR